MSFSMTMYPIHQDRDYKFVDLNVPDMEQCDLRLVIGE